MDNFQANVTAWAKDCFGVDIAISKEERTLRFLEEAIELVQACGLSKEKFLVLVNYVYSRPIGNKTQEVGGVMVTLDVLCSAFDIDMQFTAQHELARVNNLIDKIRIKHASKPENIKCVMSANYSQ